MNWTLVTIALFLTAIGVIFALLYTGIIKNDLLQDALLWNDKYDLDLVNDALFAGPIIESNNKNLWTTIRANNGC